MLVALTEPLLVSLSNNGAFRAAFPQFTALRGTRGTKCTSCAQSVKSTQRNYSAAVFSSMVAALPEAKLQQFKQFAGATGIQLRSGNNVRVI